MHVQNIRLCLHDDDKLKIGRYNCISKYTLILIYAIYIYLLVNLLR